MAPERAKENNEVILESLRPKLEDETVLNPLANVTAAQGHSLVLPTLWVPLDCTCIVGTNGLPFSIFLVVPHNARSPQLQ